MIPILHSSGLMMPGQLGPINRVMLCSLSAFFTCTCAHATCYAAECTTINSLGHNVEQTGLQTVIHADESPSTDVAVVRATLPLGSNVLEWTAYAGVSYQAASAGVVLPPCPFEGYPP